MVFCEFCRVGEVRRRTTGGNLTKIDGIFKRGRESGRWRWTRRTMAVVMLLRW